MDFSSANQTSSSNTPGHSILNNQFVDKSLGSQYPGLALSTAQLNSTIADSQTHGSGSNQHGNASALLNSSLSQFQGSGMFPSSMISSNEQQLGFPAGASIFAGGNGGNGLNMSMQPGGGMSITTNPLGFSPGGSIQNPALMAQMYPFLLGNGDNIKASAGLRGQQLLQGSTISGNTNGSIFPPQLPHNVDVNGSNGDVSSGIALGKNSSLLSNFRNIPQCVPKQIMDDNHLIGQSEGDDPNKNNEKSGVSKRKEKSSCSTFPAKLHEILARDDITDIISWCPHGRAWKVKKPKDFEEKVIPEYFRHCKYNSFARQVNGWGFRRITKGPDHNAYYHELFLRGAPHLSKRMKRLKSSNFPKAVIPPRKDEPDFYLMNEMSPLPNLNQTESLARDKMFADETCRKIAEAENQGLNSLGLNHTPNIDGKHLINGAQIQQLINPTSTNFSSLDPATRQQVLQAKYLNAMNMNVPPMAGNNGLMTFPSDVQENLQHQIMAQQALLTNLQNQRESLSQSQIGFGGIGGMGIAANTQMSALVGGGGSSGVPFQLNGIQASGFPNHSNDLFNAGSNVQFY